MVEFCPGLENIQCTGNLTQHILVLQFMVALGLLGLSPMAAVILLVTVALYIDSVLPLFSSEWFLLLVLSLSNVELSFVLPSFHCL